MATVNIHQAKTQLSRLIEQAVGGEEIVIAKAGRPVVRLVPVAEAMPRRPGIAKGRLTDSFFDPLDTEDLAAWDQ